jgi:hypothetical protein
VSAKMAVYEKLKMGGGKPTLLVLYPTNVHEPQSESKDLSESSKLAC